MAVAALDDTLYTSPVAEAALRNFSKSAKSISGSDEKLPVVLRAFLNTAYEPGISISYRAAATDAICSYIKLCNGPITPELCVQAFSVFLDRSDGAKGKSMKQYLTVLVSTLKKAPFARDLLWEEVARKVLVQVFQTIHGHSRHGIKTKAAFQVFSAFLKEKAVDQPHIEQYLSQVEVDLSFQSFVKTLFDWIRFADIAPVAGQAICAVIQTSPDVNWTYALVQSVQEYPESLMNLRHHVFPVLFMAKGVDYVAYLKDLGLDILPLICPDSDDARNLQPPDCSKRLLPMSAEKRALLFASLQVGKDVGLVLDHCKHPLNSESESPAFQVIAMTLTTFKHVQNFWRL